MATLEEAIAAIRAGKKVSLPGINKWLGADDVSGLLSHLGATLEATQILSDCFEILETKTPGQVACEVYYAGTPCGSMWTDSHPDFKRDWELVAQAVLAHAAKEAK